MNNEEILKEISEEGEEWRDVVGYEGLYQVSNLGRVRSLWTDIRHKGKILTPRVDKKGYYTVCLHKNKQMRNRFIHRLAAIAFIPNPNNYPEIDHIDGDKINNRLDNIRWCDRSMNLSNPVTRHRNSMSKMGNKSATRNPVVRINPQTNEPKVYQSIAEAERLNGLCHGKISQVCMGKRKTHGGYRWMYLSDYESSYQ